MQGTNHVLKFLLTGDEREWRRPMYMLGGHPRNQAEYGYTGIHVHNEVLSTWQIVQVC